MNVVVWIIQVLLGLMFLFAGFLKAFQYERAKTSLSWVKDVPRGWVTFIGVAELLGGLGLLLPAITGILSWLTPVAATALAIVMLLAVGFHITRRERDAAFIPVVLLVLTAFVAVGRFVIAPL